MPDTCEMPGCDDKITVVLQAECCGIVRTCGPCAEYFQRKGHCNDPFSGMPYGVTVLTVRPERQEA